MTETTAQHGRRLFGGAARILAAEALLVPVGVATAAFLSRRFGPEGYGLLALATAVVVLVESNVASALSRPAIKSVGEARDWREAGSAVVRLHLLVGLCLMLLLWAAAPAAGSLLGEPRLAGYLRLLALDVPLFCLAQAHRNIIVALGRYRERALIAAAKWAARLVLTVAFVQLSGRLSAALWGIVCASLVELIACRLFVRPRLLGRGTRTLRELRGHALVPLVASALCVSLYQRLDVLLLKALGGTAAVAGFYGAAQNVALLPSLLSFALAPALLSTLIHALREGDEGEARRVARQAMRAVVLLAPAAAVVAGAAPEIVALVFGPEFAPAAAPLRLLTFGALALVMISVATSVMIAAGKPAWTLHVAWPLVVGAAVGHLLIIPRAGATGAAAVTAGLACAGAGASVCLVWRLWRIAPPAATLWRGAVVSLLAYAVTAALPAAGASALLLKLALVCAFAVAAFALSGEFGADEIGAARSLLRRRAGHAVGVAGEAS